MRGCRYVGYALTTQWEGVEAKSQQVIGFDMGGTSTDVSRFAGSYEHVFESVTAGIALGMTGTISYCFRTPLCCTRHLHVCEGCRCDHPGATA